MKKFVQYLLPFIVICLINYRASIVLDMSFLEMTLPIGILCTIVIWIFSSKGGPFTQLLSLTDSRAARAKYNDMKLNPSKTFKEESEFVLYMNKAIIVSIIYTIIALILNIIYYWDYFKNI